MMNAQTPAIDLRDVSITMLCRLVVGFLFALFLLSATVSMAGAEKVEYFNTGLSQNGFTSTCRENGGTPKREATKVVSCTEGTTKTTCDFNQKPYAECKKVTPGSKAAPASGGEIVDATVVLDSATAAPDSAIDTQIAGDSLTTVVPGEQIVESGPAIPTLQGDVEELPVFEE